MGSLTIEGAASREYMEVRFRQAKARFRLWLMEQRLIDLLFLFWDITLKRHRTNLVRQRIKFGMHNTGIGP